MRKILIDTDCGIDDAAAIMIALASPRVEVVGITTVSGNVALEQVTDNVRRLLAFLGREGIPVLPGASRPLVEPPHPADIHGPDGLGGVELPPAGVTGGAGEEPAGLPEERERAPGDLRAPEGMARIARQNPGLTLVALGPLTNLAIALNLYPELAGLVGEAVVMGGALQAGNVTRFAEYNFWADPEAAEAVLQSSLPLTIVPWDTCLKVSCTEEELRRLGLGASRSGRLLLDLQARLLDFMEKFYGRRAVILPDPLAMACAVEPGIARRTVWGNLRMELNRTTMRGASVSVEGERLRLVLEIDNEGFTHILKSVIELVQ